MEWIQALRSALNQPLPELAESRTAYRVPVRLPATLELPNGTKVVGTVVNFSTRGLKVLLPRHVGRRHPVIVTMRGRVRSRQSPVLKVETHVIWTRRQPEDFGFEAGLESRAVLNASFDDLVNFFRAEIGLQQPTLEQRRIHRRIRSQVPIFWVEASGSKVSGLTVDLSSLGVRFVTEKAHQGRHIDLWLGLPDGAPELAVPATVRSWKPLPAEQFEAVATWPLLTRAERQRLVAWIRRVERGEVSAVWKELPATDGIASIL